MGDKTYNCLVDHFGGPCTCSIPAYEGRFTIPANPLHAIGWLCPACGRGNAPTTATCPCKPSPKGDVTS